MVIKMTTSVICSVHRMKRRLLLRACGEVVGIFADDKLIHCRRRLFLYLFGIFFVLFCFVLKTINVINHKSLQLMNCDRKCQWIFAMLRVHETSTTDCCWPGFRLSHTAPNIADKQIIKIGMLSLGMGWLTSPRTLSTRSHKQKTKRTSDTHRDGY